MKYFMILLLALGLMSGCGSSSEKISSDSKPTTLRIGVMLSAPSLVTLFQMKYPDILIEIIPAFSDKDLQSVEDFEMIYQKFTEMLTGDNPVDLVFLPEHFYQKISRDNLLKPLDAFLAQSEIREEDFIPNVIESVKKLSQGTLYGLPTSLDTTVLAYNQTKFKENNIPLPTDQITWEEIFRLATRFKKTGLGILSPTPISDLVRICAASKNLREINEDKKMVKMNTSDWAQAWGEVISFLKSKSFAQAHENHDAAMVIMPSARYYFQGFSNVNFLESKDWKLMSLPQSESEKNSSSEVRIDPIVGISKQTKNVEVAWKFIESILSPEMDATRLLAGQLPLTKLELDKFKGKMNGSIEAFYANQLSSKIDLCASSSLLPLSHYNLSMKKQQIINSILSGKSSVKKGLEDYEKYGKEILK